MKLEATKASSEHAMVALDLQMPALDSNISHPLLAPILQLTQWYELTLPRSSRWSTNPEIKEANPTANLIYQQMTETELKQRVLDSMIETAIADSGATSSHGSDTISECGRFKLAFSLISTGKPSGKVCIPIRARIVGCVDRNETLAI